MSKKTGCIRWGCGFPAAWIAAWMIFFYVSDIGCRAPDQIRTDFSGTYLCPAPEEHSSVLNPFFDHRSITSDSEIVVRQETDATLSVTQRTKDGETETHTVNLRDSQFYWRDGKLNYFRRAQPVDAILPGLGFQTWSGTLWMDATGDIHLSTVAREKALILLCIPLWKKFNSHAIELQRIDPD